MTYSVAVLSNENGVSPLLDLIIVRGKALADNAQFSHTKSLNAIVRIAFHCSIDHGVLTVFGRTGPSLLFNHPEGSLLSGHLLFVFTSWDLFIDGILKLYVNIFLSCSVHQFALRIPNRLFVLPMPSVVGCLESKSHGEVVQIGLDEIVQELYDHVLDIPRTSMYERIRILGRDNMRLRDMLCIKREQIDSLRRHMAYTQKELRQICRFRYNDRMEENGDEREDNNGYDNGNGNGDGRGTGNRNGRGGGNGNGNPNMNIGGTVPVARECTYQDFVKCRPLNFKGTEGVIGLTRWFEKMEMVFHISNCPQKYQVKYASCTLQNGALTWWNSHKRTVGTDAAYAMTWKALMKLMTEDDVRIANNLMDQKLKGYAAMNAENKRKFDNNSRDNRVK
ncbi:hypothetical protein Tco_1303661 [Tanacetum coccineum]